nr:50S ribosomal protein L11 methyltransferase [Desulfobulbaceae bacterium]
MLLSFKEYCSSDQQQLICIIRIYENGVLSEAIDSLRAISNCVYVAPTGGNQIVAASCADCDADLFLADLSRVVAGFPFDAGIEETRFGCIETSAPDKAVISKRFTVVPPGLLSDDACENTICLECSSIFGSGHHPSTRLTVKALEEIASEGVFPEQVLDIGCGSGILTFISSRLGAERVFGVDISQNSIDIAKKNMKNNQLEDKVRFLCGVLTDVTEVFDLIVANISPSVLFELIAGFPQRLSVNGKVVLSGLHRGQMAGIIEQMQQISCLCHHIYEEGSWRALTFQRTTSR